MQITTKYEVGSTGYIYQQGHIIQVEIEEIDFNVNSFEWSIIYLCRHLSGHFHQKIQHYKENEIFKSIEQLKEFQVAKINNLSMEDA